MRVPYRLLALTIAFSTACWIPSPSAFAQGALGHFPPIKPTNLQVLPKDISTQDLLRTMHGFETGLGVHCSFCHAENPQTHRLDFALDTKPHKATARVMMRMVHTVNTQYLATLPGGGAPISCYTCHRGSPMPALDAPRPEGEGGPGPRKGQRTGPNMGPGPGPGAPPSAPPQ